MSPQDQDTMLPTLITIGTVGSDRKLKHTPSYPILVICYAMPILSKKHFVQNIKHLTWFPCNAPIDRCSVARRHHHNPGWGVESGVALELRRAAHICICMDTAPLQLSI